MLHNKRNRIVRKLIQRGITSSVLSDVVMYVGKVADSEVNTKHKRLRFCLFVPMPIFMSMKSWLELICPLMANPGDCVDISARMEKSRINCNEKVDSESSPCQGSDWTTLSHSNCRPLLYLGIW